MSAFGAQQTNIDETQNFLTPKRDEADKSLATLVSGAGTAAIQGTEIAVTKEVTDFGEQYKKKYEIGLGLSDPQTLSDEEKHFGEQMQRFDQMAKTGNPGTVDIFKEKFLRDKIAEHPWLTTRYMQMANKIDSQYMDLVRVVGERDRMLAAEAAAARKAADKNLTARISRASEIAVRIGHSPVNFSGVPTAWENLTPEEFDENEKTMFILNDSQRKIEEFRRIEDQAMSKDSHSMQRTSFGNAQTVHAQQQQDRLLTQVATNEAALVQRAAFRASAEAMQANPGMSQEEAQMLSMDQLKNARQILNNRIADYAAQGVNIPQAAIDKSLAWLESSVQFTNDTFSDQTSPLGISLRHGAIQGAVMDSWSREILPLAHVMKSAGLDLSPMMGNAVFSKYLKDATLGESLLTNVSEALDQLKSNPSLDLSSVDRAPALVLGTIAAATLTSLEYRSPEAIELFRRDPGTFIKQIHTAAYAYSMEQHPAKREALFRVATSEALIDNIDSDGIGDGDRKAAYNGVRLMIQSRAADMGPPSFKARLLFDPSTETFKLKNPADAGETITARLAAMNTSYKKAKALETKMGNPSDADMILTEYFPGMYIPPEIEPTTP